MRSATPALIAALTSGQKFILADLYTFTLVDGTAVRYAVADSDITYGGHVYSGTTILITRGTIKTVIGVQVDTLNLTIEATTSHTLAGTPWTQAARQGALDGASLRLERLYMTTPGDMSLGTIVLFTGRVAPAEVGRSQIRLKVHSDLELLNVNLPRNLFQPGCINTLFDTGCALTKATYGVSGAVGASSTQTVIYSALSNPTDYFSMGTITFTSGTLSGTAASVSSYSAGTFNLLGPLLAAPAPGDTFTAYPGCDKQKNTCNTKYSNLVHFRGYPFIPQPESII